MGGWTELSGRSLLEAFPSGTVVKKPPSNAGDMGLIPGWGA